MNSSRKQTSNGVKKKKEALALKQRGELGIAPPPAALEGLLHNFGRLMGDFGFTQTIPRHLGGTNNLLNTFLAYKKTLETRPSYVAKWFYISPLEDRHEIGVFIFGDDSSLASAHLINVLNQALLALEATDSSVEITSRGCEQCRGAWMEACENVSGLDQPRIIDFLDESCRASFTEVLETIDELEIPYVLNPDYAFNFSQDKVSFRFSFGEGGNFSRMLAESSRAESTPAVGFLGSLENLAAFVPEDRKKEKIEVFLIPLGLLACRRALMLEKQLRISGVSAAESMLGNGGIKNQLKITLELGSEMALIIGQKEALDDTVILRDMRSGMQEIFRGERIIEEVKKRLGK